MDIKRIRKIILRFLAAKIIPFIYAYYLKLVYYTSKIIVAPEDEKDFMLIKKGQTACFFWHNKSSIAPFLFKKYKLHSPTKMKVLTSDNSDGRLVAGVVKRFKFGIIFGSTHKKALFALRNIMKFMSVSDSILGIAADGPRGPRMKFISNLDIIAIKNNWGVAAITCSIDRAIILRNWDRTHIPLPFSRIIFKVKYFDAGEYSSEANSRKLSNDIESFLNEKTLEIDRLLGAKEVLPGNDSKKKRDV